MKQKYWLLHYGTFAGVDGGLFAWNENDMQAVAHLWKMSVDEFNGFLDLLDAEL